MNVTKWAYEYFSHHSMLQVGNKGTLSLIINGIVTSGSMVVLPLIMNGSVCFCQWVHSFSHLS